MKKIITLLLITLYIGSYSQVAKGDRILAWQIDASQNGNYDSAFNYGLNACMESIHWSITWKDIQPDTNTFDNAFLSLFDLLNIYYPASGTSVELQVSPINTNVKETPTEFDSLSFANPLVIRHFKQLLDSIFIRIPNLTLAALNIGNEADALWGANATEYNDFKIFLDSVSPYAKQLYFNHHGEDLKIGTTLTHHGLTNAPTSSYAQNLNTGRDIISVTYYPLNNDFTMKSPSVVQADFDTLVSLYSDTNQPIYFTECGYSSSSTCNSSENQQADFYTNVFSAWDFHLNNIKYLTIFKSTDWSQATVNTFKTYYGINDTIFGEYLRTLGVRTFLGDGTNKLAYERIICELNSRNWCTPLNCNTTSIEKTNGEENIKLFPNPTFEKLTVLSIENHINKLEVFTLNGKKIKNITINNLNSIDVSSLKQGVYFIRIEVDSSIITKKIIKR